MVLGLRLVVLLPSTSQYSLGRCLSRSSHEKTLPKLILMKPDFFFRTNIAIAFIHSKLILFATNIVLSCSGDGPQCENVECPDVKPATCKGIVPPGACCPHCGKENRRLYMQYLRLKCRDSVVAQRFVRSHRCTCVLRCINGNQQIALGKTF